MKSSKNIKYYFPEEVANAISHGLGIILSVVAIMVLMVKAANCECQQYQMKVMIGGLIFGFSLFTLYLCSTLYHALIHTPRRELFRMLDHVAIYILIAGSYTIFCLSTLDSASGMRLLIEIWLLAIIGICCFLFLGNRFSWISLVFYLAMGWLAVTEMDAFKNISSTSVFYLILAGGCAYTVGSIFYACQKLKWMHFIWHLFVLAGSTLHVLAACFAI
ncbi:MAG: hemolysin III family protein [Planctomycetia bacterium]|nr:hemolysin III family protein [Planctomycetia bacterium]